MLCNMKSPDTITVEIMTVVDPTAIFNKGLIKAGKSRKDKLLNPREVDSGNFRYICACLSSISQRDLLILSLTILVWHLSEFSSCKS